MAIVKRFVSYKIPENRGYDKLELWESATETGTFALLTTIDYTFPTRATEIDIINTEKYYKVRFKNVTENRYSPYTDVFFGGHFDDKEGFAAITTTYDGAGYATATMFYAVTNVESSQIPLTDVQSALYTARSFIDILADDQGPSKYFRNSDQAQTRRKFNAELDLTMKAEIYFAAALVYDDMADDKAMEAISGQIFTVPAPPDVTAVTDVSGNLYNSGTDLTLPSGIIGPAQPTEPGDLTADANITASSGNVESFSIGATSITSTDGGKQTDSDVAAGAHNLNKDVTVAEYNDDKELDYNRASIDRELAYSRANIDKDIDMSRYNEEKNIDAYRANRENELNTNRFNTDKAISVSQYNFEKDVAYANYLNQLQTNRLLAEADFLRARSVTYLNKAEVIINMFQPTFVSINYGETARGHKFINPGDIFSFTAATSATSGSLFTTSTATLTGFASGIQESGYILSNVTVNGVSGQNVEPTESATLIVSSSMTVNGVEYFNDYWFNSDGNIQVGQNGDSTSTNGFSIDYDTGVSGVAIRWNNVAASGGFTLEDGDIVNYTYTTV